MKEYQVVEGVSVEQLNVRIAELGVKGWKALTMRCVPLNRPSGEVLATSVSTQNQVALYVLMELDVAESVETVSAAGQ
jgi:hypothetical protein